MGENAKYLNSGPGRASPGGDTAEAWRGPTMTVTVCFELQGHLKVEVPEHKRKAMRDLDLPMSLDDFELFSGIHIDADDLLNAGDVEIDDVYFPAAKKTKVKKQKGGRSRE